MSDALCRELDAAFTREASDREILDLIAATLTVRARNCRQMATRLERDGTRAVADGRPGFAPFWDARAAELRAQADQLDAECRRALDELAALDLPDAREVAA